MVSTGALHIVAALAMQVSGATPQVVPAGDALEVRLGRGQGAVRVEAWARDEIEVTGRHSDGIRLEVKEGRTVEVQEFRPPRAALERTEYEIRVPVATFVSIVADDARIEVQGLRASVDVNVNHGSIEVQDVEGHLFLDTTTGTVTIENAIGDAIIDATSGSITINGLQGALSAETVAGDIQLQGIATDSLFVTTNHGNVLYEGTIEPGGTYDLASQTGVVELRLPTFASAAFEVGTVSGFFQSEFDLGGIEPMRGDTFTFTLGSGGARVSVITYNGNITIGRSEP